MHVLKRNKLNCNTFAIKMFMKHVTDMPGNRQVIKKQKPIRDLDKL